MNENKKEVTIKLANTAGFCFGVKRAVNTVYEQIDAGNKNIVEVGILFGTATVDVSSCRYKATSQWNKSHGQFTASRNSDEAYARGYLIYDDGGTYKVIYTEAVAVK